MNTLNLITSLTAAEVAAVVSGKWLDHRHYDHLVSDTMAVFKPNGELLLIYVKDVIPRGLCEQAFAIAKLVKVERAGTERLGQRWDSGIIGYFDRMGGRFPFCRQTAFSIDHHAEFMALRPFVSFVNQKFADFVPDRYALQHDVVAHTQPAWIIRGSVFSTITVNRNFRTPVHKDSGDYHNGFGVLCALHAGRYDGCELIFPEYRCAVDMRTGGLLFADVHEWHGNAPLIGTSGEFARISMVFYYRSRMVECGSPEQEFDRAKRRAGRLIGIG